MVKPNPLDPPNQSELSVYIHWPFCVSKCPYCDFNSHVKRDVSTSSWSNAIGDQIARGADLLGVRTVSTIFFGGGTPSLIQPAIVGEILNQIHKRWNVKPDVEVTLEANPNSSEATKFSDFLEAGVNRLSLGVQSLNDKDLQFLGRQHSAKEARKAADVARAIFPRFSIDLIYSLPGQSLGQWEQELTDAIKMVGEHISLYQLTIEKGTPFYTTHRNGNLSLPKDTQALQLYNLTQEIMGTVGISAYEISNHAKPGYESLHNLTYWQYRDYLGVGPGAHSRLTINNEIYAISQVRSPAKWLEATKRGAPLASSLESLSLIQCVREMVMMGLRLTNGINKNWFQTRLNYPLNNFLDAQVLSALVENELVIENTNKLGLTSSGRALINPILERLLP